MSEVLTAKFVFAYASTNYIGSFLPNQLRLVFSRLTLRRKALSPLPEVLHFLLGSWFSSLGYLYILCYYTALSLVYLDAGKDIEIVTESSGLYLAAKSDYRLYRETYACLVNYWVAALKQITLLNSWGN